MAGHSPTHTRFRRRLPWLANMAVHVGVSLGGLFAVASWATATEPLANYTDTLKPLLAERCYSCHGGLKQEAGLRLDTVSLMRQGGDSGAAIAADQPDTSLLLTRVADTDPSQRMPPEGEGEPLTSEQVAQVAAWIAAGAPAPADEKPESSPADHWAFQPRVRPAVPAVANAAWVRNPIDAFLSQAHQQQGLTPQPEASRNVLARRLYLDLIGLLPTPEELAALEADASSDWYEKLVDRLLADPRHGERWARHWMDVWRYSDWWGLGADHRNSQKHMWHWRDWIIESLNGDLPYDEMLRQMLAADEIYPEDEAKVRATGYLGRNWFKYQRTQWLEDTVEHVGKGMLGLTLNCAKCHDHKYDPLPQEDFYRMRAFFEPYHMRLDMVAGEANYENDGIPRAFDAFLDTPTYLFVRGDETKADQTRPLTPAVPGILAFKDISIQPISLPQAAWQPVRRPGVIDGLVGQARQAATAAEQALAQAVAKRTAAEATLAAIEQAEGDPAGKGQEVVVAEAEAPSAGALVDQFAILDPNRWSAAGGRWTHEPGRVLQDIDGDVWAGLRLSDPQPRDFDTTVEFTIEGGRLFRSVGIAFDSIGAVDPGVPGSTEDGAAMVYVSANDGAPKVQGAYRRGGQWQYPSLAAAAAPVKQGGKHTLRVATRDTLVNAWLDGRRVLSWRMPVARRDGALQVIAYDIVVAVHRFSLEKVAAETTVSEPAGGGESPKPAAEAALAAAIREAAAAGQAAAVAKATCVSVERRADAMRAAWVVEEEASGTVSGDDAKELARSKARAAAKAEKELTAARARQRVGQAEAKLTQAATDQKEPAEKELAAAVAALDQAEKDRAEPGDAFTPLTGGASWSTTTFGFPDKPDPEPPMTPTSTGRRKALAEWITDPRNPLTPRVAINHIWMRHMGRPLVPTVFDFGRKGTPPDSPQLLDWLASELVDVPAGGPAWSMKRIHRLIVTSAAYRMSSSTAGAEANVTIDPDNRSLWRRDQIRIESQVVRDCVLQLADRLDPTIGGPSILPDQQAASVRRSIYFFHSSADRNPFLAAFDEADVQDCYRRDQSIVPQQALALSNGAIVHDNASAIAVRVAARQGPQAGGGETASPAADADFIAGAFVEILGRPPADTEVAACLESLAAWRVQEAAVSDAGASARTHLVWALLNHNDFVTLR